jgi:hypothetical protein
MSQLYLFRNVLLVSLIAILVYIMYKRLIHLLQRQHVQAKYPALDAALLWTDKVVSMNVELKIKMDILVTVCKENGELLQEVHRQTDAIGKIDLSFDTTALQKGKYYFEIQTPHEKALRYFVID